MSGRHDAVPLDDQNYVDPRIGGSLDVNLTPEDHRYETFLSASDPSRVVVSNPAYEQGGGSSSTDEQPLSAVPVFSDGRGTVSGGTRSDARPAVPRWLTVGVVLALALAGVAIAVSRSDSGPSATAAAPPPTAVGVAVGNFGLEANVTQLDQLVRAQAMTIVALESRVRALEASSTPTSPTAAPTQPPTLPTAAPTGLPTMLPSSPTPASAVPVGSVIWFAANTPPQGYLVCDGQSVSRTEFPALSTVLGTTFGGNGSVVRLPDLRGEFIRGFDGGRGVDAARRFASGQSHMFQDHVHAVASDVADGRGVRSGVSSPPTRVQSSTFLTTTPRSGLHGNETRPRNVALLPCIRQ
eukprot:m.25176 g.25176  ORF g.25176 m.25176 type:complete len:353 (+) comp6168_c0_seq1:37-1095(+)